ncbi:hypothetical protein ACJIZ3_006270 [Penstemon smallii]|uniref:Uncharacterized protein n=1 Tax=Penstemon smallii TaxID=265156 RepID=A0ABD3S768_9LAMI
MPQEYHNSLGHIVLDYAKAIHESVFEKFKVVPDGQLQIVFSSDRLRICSWEFCVHRHEELIPRILLIPLESQLSTSFIVSQLGDDAQKYKVVTQNATSIVSLVNYDLGYTKRYVRCLQIIIHLTFLSWLQLQISEMVNRMKDLIDYSRETDTCHMEILAKFPRRTNHSPMSLGQNQQPWGHKQQNKEWDQTRRLIIPNGIPSVNNITNSTPTTSSNSTIVGLLHQNSMNSLQQNPMSNTKSPYGGGNNNNSVQMSSPGSSNTMPQTQSTPSLFQFPTPSTSYNHGDQMNWVNSPNISMQQPAIFGDNTDANDSQSSV